MDNKNLTKEELIELQKKLKEEIHQLEIKANQYNPQIRDLKYDLTNCEELIRKKDLEEKAAALKVGNIYLNSSNGYRMFKILDIDRDYISSAVKFHMFSLDYSGTEYKAELYQTYDIKNFIYMLTTHNYKLISKEEIPSIFYEIPKVED